MKKEINYQLLIRRICLIVLDIICIIAASILALLTRFEFDFSQIPKEFLKVIYKYGPFTIVITLIIFSLFRIYSSLWEYAGIEEVFSLIVACLAAAVAKIVIILFTWSVMPRSWYVLDTIYLMILIGATRVSYRLIRLRRQNRTFPWSKRKKVMIIGGGEAGRSLITEIQNSKYLDQKVVCIIDDDPYKIGRYIKGVKVVGNRNSIKKSVKKYNVQQIILTIPSANAAKIRPIVEICQDTNCELMILPGVYQLVNGEVKASKLRPVNIDDLLGRDEVHVNLNEVMDYVSGRVIMVTGGGGSIGSELCRQIAKHSPKQLIIFDIYENNAYDIQQELLREQPKLDLVVLIGSVRDENRINSIFEQYRPEIIYHAAAHKHVPLMEGSPNEAIKNNVLGTYNMVRMADKWNAKRFVQISTDKAVNPTNIMGASKRICEMIIQTSAVVPYDMELQRKETKEMLDDLTTRDQRMMFGILTMVHMADSKKQLDSDTETLYSIARKHLCQMATLKWQQVDGLNTVLPYGLRKIDAVRTLTTESTAVLIPFHTQEIMQPGGIYYGQNAVSKNMLVADRRKLLNGNSFRLGVSGSGKSFSAKEEIVDLALSTEDDILILDPESEFASLVEALNGEVIRISATSDTHLNALDMDSAYGNDRNPLIEKSEFILSLFEQLVGAGNLSAKEKSILDRCTADVYRDYMRGGYKGQVPTLKDLYRQLMLQPEEEARGLALSSELFINGSLNTFAQETNVNTKSRIIDYDIWELGEQLMPLGMLVTLDSIFNRVIQNWKKGKTTWIFADEFYLLFRYEYSADFFYRLYKRIRKYSGFVTGLTQNVEELLKSDTARLMLANSEFLILLNQATTDRDELAALLNISDNQLSYITNVGAGHGLIRCSGNLVPFENSFPRNTKLYRLMTTKPGEA